MSELEQPATPLINYLEVAEGSYGKYRANLLYPAFIVPLLKTNKHLAIVLVGERNVGKTTLAAELVALAAYHIEIAKRARIIAPDAGLEPAYLQYEDTQQLVSPRDNREDSKATLDHYKNANNLFEAGCDLTFSDRRTAIIDAPFLANRGRLDAVSKVLQGRRVEMTVMWLTADEDIRAQGDENKQQLSPPAHPQIGGWQGIGQLFLDSLVEQLDAFALRRGEIHRQEIQSPFCFFFPEVRMKYYEENLAPDFLRDLGLSPYQAAVYRNRLSLGWDDKLQPFPYHLKALDQHRFDFRSAA